MGKYLEEKCYSNDRRISPELNENLIKIKDELDKVSAKDYYRLKGAVIYSLLMNEENLKQNQVLERICNLTNYDHILYILEESRSTGIVNLRFAAVSVYKDRFKVSYPKIKVLIEKSDHTTCLYGYRKIKETISNNKDLISRAVNGLTKLVEI